MPFPVPINITTPDLGLPWPQDKLPIVFLLFGEGIPFVIPFNIPAVGMVRPQQVTLRRPSRGTVVGTARGAFLDDFGEGVPQLLIQGHTGWKENLLSGITGLKALELMFIEYLRRRRRVELRNGNPNNVKLWYLDALSVEALEVYPHSWNFDKAKGPGALLYHYRMDFSVVKDLLYDAVYDFLDLLPGIVSGGLGLFTDAWDYLSDLFGEEDPFFT